MLTLVQSKYISFGMCVFCAYYIFLIVWKPCISVLMPTFSVVLLVADLHDDARPRREQDKHEDRECIFFVKTLIMH